MADQTLSLLKIALKSSGTYDGKWSNTESTPLISSYSPIDGSELASVYQSSLIEVDKLIEKSVGAFQKWKTFPAPKRGELIRQIGDKFRENKQALAKLISLEMGKPLSESEGEIQEVIDICDFAVGLSRMLYGKTMHSERPSHRMYEQWHPIGPVAVITAFNFPAAVWAWNAMIAGVCGNTVIWKGSEKTPLIAIACIKICEDIFNAAGFPSVFSLVTGRADIGAQLAGDHRIPLVSATGSTEMGKKVGTITAARFGRSLLELGGNNAIIVLADADLELAARGIAFGAAGTAGQRCTTTRRLLVEEPIFDKLVSKIKEIYAKIKIGDPLDKNNLIGPLIDKSAVECFTSAIAKSLAEGGKLLYGGKTVNGQKSALYVEPTIIQVEKNHLLPTQETFAPILYVYKIKSLQEAIELNNSVPHGLSSSLFSNSLKSSEMFLSSRGSDCGIANINIGTSGAEIGGAFGGEKETGGGREAGSDSWKAYMRRQTSTINWGDELPLAQGVKFEG